MPSSALRSCWRPCSHVDQLGKRIHQLSPETPATCPTGQTTIGFAAVPSANVSGPRSLCSPQLARDDSTSQKLAGATLRDAQRLGQFFVAKTVRALREERLNHRFDVPHPGPDVRCPCQPGSPGFFLGPQRSLGLARNPGPAAQGLSA
jgi:hypothetical protein